MNAKKELYKQLYTSDIFHMNTTDQKKETTRPVIRINKKKYEENTKETLFNISPERRIRRNRRIEEEEKQNRLNRSAVKRRYNNAKFFGSDIFNQNRPSSIERRIGVKMIPNKTNTSALFHDSIYNDDYIKELKEYTYQHRAPKKEYDPDSYIRKIIPQAKYYKEHFENHQPIVNLEDTNKKGKKEERKMNNYVHNKIYLNKEIKKYNNGKEKDHKERRYVRQKTKEYYGERPKFCDSVLYGANTSRINKQIQLESHILCNENKNKDFQEDVKKIKERLDQGKRKGIKTNVLGQPIKKIKKEKEPVYNNYEENKCQTARERKKSQLRGSQNIDILTGLKRDKPNNNIYNYNADSISKFVEIIDENPNLKDEQKREIKMKASDLDCKNEKEWNNKAKMLNDFYIIKNSQPPKGREITEKINNQNEDLNNNKADKDTLYHDYTITYGTKGNEFEKFDELDIQKLLGTKGIKAYDIHKNFFDKGSYNVINLKVKGKDNNEVYNKMKKVEGDLRKQNYKIAIEKEKTKNYRKISVDHKNKGGSRFKMVPKTKKVFSNQITKFQLA